MSRSKDGAEEINIELLGKTFKECSKDFEEFLGIDLEVSNLLEEAFEREKELKGTILGMAINFALAAGLITSDKYETNEELVHDLQETMGDDAVLEMSNTSLQLQTSLLDECSVSQEHKGKGAKEL